MKRALFITTLILFITSAFSQTQYEVLKDKNGTKLLKGIINSDMLANDTAFTWYRDNQVVFVPDAEAVKTLKSKKKKLDDLTFLVFCGTWCSDSKKILPHFYSYIDAAGFSEKRVTLVALDRLFNTVNQLSVTWKVSNIPTFIILKDGKEVGRVEENGKEGSVEKSLAALLLTIE